MHVTKGYEEFEIYVNSVKIYYDTSHNSGTDNFGMDIFPALRTPFHSLNCSRTMQTNVEYYVQLTW